MPVLAVLKKPGPPRRCRPAAQLVIVWCVMTSLSLLAPDDPFARNPAYVTLASLPFPAWLWGCGVLTIGVLIAACCVCTAPVLRWIAAVHAAPLLVGYGALLALGAASRGSFAPAGFFDMLIGSLCALRGVGVFLDDA